MRAGGAGKRNQQKRTDLEAAAAELGRRVDELERDRLEVLARLGHLERLADGDDALLDAGDGALEHEEVVVDVAVAHKAAEGRDRLFGQVGLGRGALRVCARADAVDLLVELGTVVVTVLTCACDREHDVGRVPGANARDLAEATVRLARELLGAPTVGDTLEAVALGDGDDIDVLVLLEERRDLDGLLKVRLGKLDLVGDRAAVDLDLHQVGLLLLEASLADLGVREHAHDRAVLGDALKVARLVALGVLGGVLGESLLLGAVPILVEAALDLLREVLGPDGRERAQATGRLDVANDADDDHGRSVDDGDGLDDLLLVHL